MVSVEAFFFFFFFFFLMMNLSLRESHTNPLLAEAFPGNSNKRSPDHETVAHVILAVKTGLQCAKPTPKGEQKTSKLKEKKKI
jgi:hypothetical protein